MEGRREQILTVARDERAKGRAFLADALEQHVDAMLAREATIAAQEGGTMGKDATELRSASSASVQTGRIADAPLDHPGERLRAELNQRRLHLAELERRVQQPNLSAAKSEKYQAALDRARAEIAALEQECAQWA